MLCEDLSQQAQQATEEAERLQAELTAAKEKLEARSRTKDTIEEVRHVVRRLVSASAAGYAEAQRLQAELDLMTISQPNVGEADGDVELFEQLVAAQKEELEVLRELTDSSAETIRTIRTSN